MTYITPKQTKTKKPRKEHSTGWSKTNAQMKRFYEGRLGIPATVAGRPSKNGIWSTPSNPTGAGNSMLYPTPEDMGKAFEKAIRLVAQEGMPITKNNVLIQMGLSRKSFSNYKKREAYEDVIDSFDLFCESYMENIAIVAGSNQAISILKMNHNKTEKQVIEVKPMDGQVVDLTEAQLRDLANISVEDAVEILPKQIETQDE